jgi:hypothetical protein
MRQKRMTANMQGKDKKFYEKRMCSIFQAIGKISVAELIL